MIKNTASRIICGAALFALALLPVACNTDPKESSVWLTDLPTALKQAKAENKVVFMDFTGSDWCIGCIDFHKKVRATPEFEDYAKTNLVLMEVDFPEHKTQPEELAKANKALSEKYGVDGFPTFIVLDGNGNMLTKFDSYVGETPDEFIAKLEKAKKK